jgi:hypothetical protein
MGQERWRLQQSSYIAGAEIDRDGTSALTSDWVLAFPLGGNVPSTTTSAWEGSRCILTTATSSELKVCQVFVPAAPAANIYQLDFLVFIPTSVTGSISLGVCGNTTTSEYSWVELVQAGGNYQATVKSYDPVNGVATRASAVTAGAVNNWCRVRIVTTAKAVSYAELWTGSALPLPDGTNELASPTATTAAWSGGTFSNWLSISVFGDSPPADIRIDDVLFDLFAPPTRVDPNAAREFTGIVPI